ncbi:LysR family transcriptional regulator [Cupriavidus basilensis]
MTKAARVLNLTQPALSKTLARLRVYFGDPLFVRVGAAHGAHAQSAGARRAGARYPRAHARCARPCRIRPRAGGTDLQLLHHRCGRGADVAAIA